MTAVARLLYRARLRIMAAGVLLILLSTVLRLVLPDGGLRSALGLGPLLGVVLMGVALVVSRRGRPVDPGGARAVASPVRGRWRALNSPATRVPSHGTRAYGQAYAIDLVHEPDEGARPAFGAGFRPAGDYPAFGEPVLAMVAGVVVAASDRQRDHRARSSWLGFAYLVVEGAVRELGGPRFVVGNHVVVRTPEGAHALVAHLRRGSLRVAPGDAVVAGQQIAECGNSGNSSEPHVHAQLMDRASLWEAQGLPMAFRGIEVTGDGEAAAGAADGLPGNDEVMLAARSGADWP
ncbi:M23 family metallopeptidase [Cellulomonas pakistanensis]|uniref:M23ase beta-sheet core domain-containing protein n=1 Tax=Cellulomonas pakistanensis TaxID=992287 RepID=A0A919PC59_9CELL|nr:M23 family metallopeptidase [Cellulomonas pakistanensis]GIG35537.1 hypothetical protein Cpa01nite_09180 [Cellulomonas pakistanensis]